MEGWNECKSYTVCVERPRPSTPGSPEGNPGGRRYRYDPEILPSILVWQSQWQSDLG